VNTLKKIFEPIKQELILVEEELNGWLYEIDKKYGSINYRYEYTELVINHLFKSPGKRLRPALVLFSAKIVKNIDPQKRDDLIKLAAAAELIHSASLIHDDLIDDSKYRRNQLSLNKKYNNSIAVLVGDIFYSQFFSLLTNIKTVSNDRKMKIFHIFCNTTQKMCMGEIWEHHLLETHKSPSLPEYLELLENKTATLMSACCQSGALLNGADEITSQYIADFGLHFGIAYQLADDHIDNDSLLKGNVDLSEMILTYIKRAKEDISNIDKTSSNDNLLRLCDFLFPIFFPFNKY